MNVTQIKGWREGSCLGVPPDRVSPRSGNSLNLALFSFMEASLQTCDWHRDTQGMTLIGRGLQRSGEA